MNRAELRALIEVILTSEDPSLRAGDRLRAAEMLRDLDEGPTLEAAIEETTAAPADEELHAWTDATLAALVVGTGDRELRARWPETARVLDIHIEERAGSFARLLPPQDAFTGVEMIEGTCEVDYDHPSHSASPIASEIASENTAEVDYSRRSRRSRRPGRQIGWHPL